MHVERLGENKVRIFISYDDLEERGIDREEIWHNGHKVQELFWDMMERAYLEVGFEVAGPIAVEAFTMPTEGVVVIVTQISSLSDSAEKSTEEMDSFVEDERNPALRGSFTFVFQEFEDVLAAARALQETLSAGCSLYHYKGRYYLYISEEAIRHLDEEDLYARLSEYGRMSGITQAVLEEYGKLVIADTALPDLAKYFPD